MSLDLKKFTEGLQDYIARAIRPLAQRLAELEARPAEKGEKGDPGPAGEPGRDGQDGAPGADVDEVLAAVKGFIELEVEKSLLALERRADLIIERAVGRIPTPKDGRDALDVEDFFVEGDGERLVRFGLRRGEDEIAHELKFPGLIYRGVWKAGAFEKGDCATFGGSLWVAKQDTESKPGTDDTWQLAAKKGRDGKDKA